MNLVELYQKTPAERHGDIKVIGDRVLVRAADFCIDEYLIDASGELWLAHSNRQEREDLQAIKTKLDVEEIVS